MSWLRRHWRLALAFLAVGLGCILLAILYIMRKRKEAQELAAQLAFTVSTAKVAGLEDDKKQIDQALGLNSEKAKVLEAKILAVKKEAVAIRTNVEEMTDDQVVAAFKALGF
jgi:hypothetical protein